jgi:hypothetical protein
MGKQYPAANSQQPTPNTQQATPNTKYSATNFRKNIIENTRHPFRNNDSMCAGFCTFGPVHKIWFMTVTDILGFSGVFILLLAYFFTLIGKLSMSSPWYLALNLAGSSLAGLASVFLHYVPFIILEGIWALVSLVALIRSFKK